MTYSFTRTYTFDLTPQDFVWMYYRYLDLRPSCYPKLHEGAALTAVTDWCAAKLPEDVYWALCDNEFNAIFAKFKEWMRGQ